MPYVRIDMIQDGANTEQKAELIRGVTDVFVQVLGRNPEGVYIAINEIPPDNWGIGYQTAAERRRSKESDA